MDHRIYDGDHRENALDHRIYDGDHQRRDLFQRLLSPAFRFCNKIRLILNIMNSTLTFIIEYTIL